MGSRIAIWLVKGIAHLPLPLLYFLSDLAYLILFRVKGYRKHIVLANLRYAFPEKAEDEIQSISKRFYRHFFDLIVESIKLRTISRSQLMKRVTFAGKFDVQEFMSGGQNTLAALGHVGNWEWCASRYALSGDYGIVIVYKKLKNQAFEALMAQNRTRFGAWLYPSKQINELMERDQHKLRSVALMADQKPPHDKVEWVTFFGRPTAAYTGLARFSKQYNDPVVFISIRKQRRGHYSISSETLIRNPREYSDHEILQKFFDRLEVDIRSQPEAWLWTHRRWRKKGDQATDIYD